MSISPTYLDNAQAQTGKSPDEFRVLAEQAGLTKHGQILAWLKSDYGLGDGHATAVTHVILKGTAPGADTDADTDAAVAKHFVGARAIWQ